MTTNYGYAYNLTSTERFESVSELAQVMRTEEKIGGKFALKFLLWPSFIYREGVAVLPVGTGIPLNVLMQLPSDNSFVPPRAFGTIHPRTYLMVFYRTDIKPETVHATGLDTWQQLLSIVQAVNGTDMDGDGMGDWGLCMDLHKGCMGGPILSAIAASMIQSHGLSHGLYLDPVTLQPLMDNAAMAEAVSLFQQLLLYTHPSFSTTCGTSNQQFISGKCWSTITWDVGFRNMAAANISGKIGAAPLPGSTHVLDRSTGQLVQCGRTTCPYAVQVPISQQAQGEEEDVAHNNTNGTIGTNVQGSSIPRTVVTSHASTTYAPPGANSTGSEAASRGSMLVNAPSFSAMPLISVYIEDGGFSSQQVSCNNVSCAMTSWHLE